jgi:hypothetical protein
LRRGANIEFLGKSARGWTRGINLFDFLCSDEQIPHRSIQGSFSRREKLLIFSVPFYITWLQIARLNGEGYRLKFEEYWRIIMLRFAMWFVVFLIVVFLYGLIQPAT